MKKTFKLLPFLMAALMLVSCRPNKPSGEEEPRVTPVPEAEYTVSHIVRYWPEDADYETCDYACVAQVPEFSMTQTSGYAMNAAVDAYLEELAARIENEYMPKAEAKPPFTEVTFEYRYENGVSNVVFREKHSWEVVPYYETHVLMLNEKGERINLNDVFMNYHAEDRIAEALAKRLERDSRFAPKTKEELIPLLDIREAACAIDPGARIYIRRGGLAPLEEGELAFDISYEEVLPEILGDGETELSELRGIVKLLRDVSNAAVVRGQGFEEGETTAYTATAFMARAVRELGIVPAAGRIQVPQKDFESLYRACTGAGFPGIDTEAHSIELKEGAYSVSATLPAFEYNVDILSFMREGERITIEGDMIYGAFGFASTEFNAHVHIELCESSESPYGFAVSVYRITG